MLDKLRDPQHRARRPDNGPARKDPDGDVRRTQHRRAVTRAASSRLQRHQCHPPSHADRDRPPAANRQAHEPHRRDHLSSVPLFAYERGVRCRARPVVVLMRRWTTAHGTVGRRGSPAVRLECGSRFHGGGTSVRSRGAPARLRVRVRRRRRCFRLGARSTVPRSCAARRVRAERWAAARAELAPAGASGIRLCRYSGLNADRTALVARDCSDDRAS